MVHVEVSSRQRIEKINTGAIKRLVRAVLSDLGVADAHLEVALVDNPTIHRVNMTYLRHDWPTDVVTFPHPALVKAWGGEIVVSVEYAREQAPKYGHGIEAEVYLYIIHGLLHLAGYDDHAPADRRRMHARQRSLLKKFLTGADSESGTRIRGQRNSSYASQPATRKRTRRRKSTVGNKSARRAKARKSMVDDSSIAVSP